MSVPSEPRLGLHPRGTLLSQAPDSERKVYDALVGALPAGWSSWHSLKIHIKAGDFSEADFVIADPARGILVLEVKGGIVRKQDGSWFQNERPMKMPSLDQAHRFVRVLLGEFGARAGPQGGRRGAQGPRPHLYGGAGPRARRDPEFWDQVTRLAAESGALWKGCGFDTVIVDEGQDFGKHEWAIEKHAVKFDLGRPYRCTPGIQALADAYVGGRTGEGGESARGLKEKDGREPLELHSTVTLKEESG